MIGRIVIAAGFLGALATGGTVAPATAASFDCAKASTTYENAVCSNSELSALDDTLAVAYATAIGGLTKPAVGQMRDNERAWLDYAEQSCTGGEPPLRGSLTDDLRNCFHSEIFNRIRTLEQSRMLEGHRFYMVEDFKVLPADTEASGVDYIKVATKLYASPRIDGTDDTAVAFNAFAEDVLATTMAGAGEGAGPDDRTSDVDTDIKVSGASSARITLTINDWWYGHGAAHGNYTVTYAHFLPEKNRALEAADVFAGDGWQAPLARLAYDALKVSLGENMWEDLEDPVKDWVVDPARWDFSRDGLIIQFQPYEVTAYAAGAPTVTIPWQALQDYTTDFVYGLT